MINQDDYMHTPDCKDRQSAANIISDRYIDFQEWCNDFFVESIDKGFRLRFDIVGHMCINIYIIKENFEYFKFNDVRDDVIKFLTILSDDYLVYRNILCQEIDATTTKYSFYDVVFNKVSNNDIRFIGIRL